jgi:hypothetical protein
MGRASKKENPCCRNVYILVGQVKTKSYPIQDEPEGEVGFQHKMSLERMAC